MPRTQNVMRTRSVTRRRAVSACLRLALGFTVWACAGFPSVPARAGDPATFTVGAFTFKRPAAWTWVPVNSPMRKAQLHVADPANPGGPGADVVFYHFGPGQGGSVDENISRWLGQFGEQGDDLKFKIDNATAKGTKITRLQVDSGTFSSGMPGGPTTPLPAYGLYGAILESPQGDVFIKMTGPAALVKSAAADFAAMLQSPF
jgi:hypothetical protein